MTAYRCVNKIVWKVRDKNIVIRLTMFSTRLNTTKRCFTFLKCYLTCLQTSQRNFHKTTIQWITQMELDAQAYSQLNKPQYDAGADFISSLNLAKGSKVLDMGCGTGEVTKFIADVVGHDGEVVGVDPDEARIKIAQEKFKDIENVKFLVGNSVTGFPHDSNEYYDLHFSNHVFHWILGEEKKFYVQKAHRCLKPGGRIAIQASMKTDIPLPEVADNVVELLGEEEYILLVEDIGRFRELQTNFLSFVSHYASLDEFAAWVEASTHKKFDLVKDWVKHFLSTEDDGRLRFEMKDLIIQITGKK